MPLSVAIFLGVGCAAFIVGVRCAWKGEWSIIDPIVESMEGLGKMIIKMGETFWDVLDHTDRGKIPPPPPLPWWGDERRSLRLEREAGLVFDDHDLLLPGYHHEKHVQMMIEVAPGLCAEHLVRVLCAEEDGTLRFPNGEILILEKPVPMSDAKPYLVMSTPISSRTDPGVDLPGRRTRRMQSGDWPRLIGLADLMDFDEHRREET